MHGALTLNKVAGNFHVTAGKVTTIIFLGNFSRNVIFVGNLPTTVSLATILCLMEFSPQVLPIMGAHAHMTGFMETSDYNFSHR